MFPIPQNRVDFGFVTVPKPPRGSKGREVKKWVVVTTPRCVEECFGVVAHLSFRGAGHLKPQSGCVPRNGRASQFSTLYVRGLSGTHLSSNNPLCLIYRSTFPSLKYTPHSTLGWFWGFCLRGFRICYIASQPPTFLPRGSLRVGALRI